MLYLFFPYPVKVMLSDMEAQEHFDEFFEEIFTEIEDKYGEIEEMNICDNLGDHLVGNVYIKVHAVIHIAYKCHLMCNIVS